MTKILILGPVLSQMTQIRVSPLLCNSFFCHTMQFKGKLMNQTLENGKKDLILDMILAQICSSKIFVAHFTSNRCYKLLQAITECN